MPYVIMKGIGVTPRAPPVRDLRLLWEGVFQKSFTPLNCS
jgi:hypothetical protein